MSITGAFAAQWIPIRPRTDGAVLFAVLHVLLYEHPLTSLDVAFLRDRTASPCLVGPNRYYLRSSLDNKPLVWDVKQNAAVAFDTPGIEPALTGRYRVSGSEVGADGEERVHRDVEATTAFELLKQHVSGYTPEWAEPISDVAADTIRRVINQFLAEARIGATIVIEGRELPYRPVSIMLGRNVNNGWGSYECVWARTVLMTLVGGLEVPGSLLGGLTVINALPFDRTQTVQSGVDGFMDFPFNPTDAENWIVNPEMRHAHCTLLPLIREAADDVQGHDGIMINAQRARELGIGDGDLIEIESPVGSARGVARPRQGVRPDVVIMLAQFGHWKTPYAKDLNRPSLNNLVPMLMDRTDATGSNNDMVRVRVKRVPAAGARQ